MRSQVQLRNELKRAKPLLPLRFAGLFPFRAAERQFAGLLSHEPPAKTPSPACRKKNLIARSARDKGKVQKSTGQQGYSTQGYGVRNNRNPKVVMR